MDYTDLSPKQRRSARHVLIGIAAAHSAGFTLVCHWGSSSGAIRWLAAASAASAWIYCRFRSLLPLNRRVGETAVFPDLGAANRITLLRGILVAQLAGVALLPWFKMTPGPWPWIPAMLYGAAVVLDAADGYIARRTGRVTRMGAQLDMETDALGMLAASVVAVTADQLPPAYLAAGLAYYLFAAGIRIRHFLGKPVGEVRPWQGARVIAGFQMVFLVLALLPVGGPPATTLAAWIVMTPLLAGFGRDWLIVCGVVTNDCFTRTGRGRWAYLRATSRGINGAPIAAAGFGSWWVAAAGAVKRTSLRMFLWYAVALAALAFCASAAGYFRPERLWAALRHVRISSLLWLVTVNGIILLTMTGRWWRILSAFGHRILLGRLVCYRISAGAVSYVTPGTQFGGEPLQAFLLVNRENVPADTAVAAVFLERAMEMVLNLVLVGGGVVWMAGQPFLTGKTDVVADAFRRGSAVKVLMAIGFVAAVVVLIWKILQNRRCSPAEVPLLQRLRRLMLNTSGKIGEIFRHHPGALVSAMGLSLVNWGFLFVEFYILYGCVGEWLPARQVFVVLVAARLGLWVPVPGGMGALEAGQLMAARLMGLAPEAAMGVCLLIRLRDFIVCSAGLYLTGRYIAKSIKGNGHGEVEKEI